MNTITAYIQSLLAKLNANEPVVRGIRTAIQLAIAAGGVELINRYLVQIGDTTVQAIATAVVAGVLAWAQNAGHAPSFPAVPTGDPVDLPPPNGSGGFNAP